jgi:hypothetical protein
MIDVGSAIIGAIPGLGAAGWQVARYLRERKEMRRHGLAENPDRCAKHEVQISQLEEQFEGIDGRLDRVCQENREEHHRIFSKLETLAVDLARMNGKR